MNLTDQYLAGKIQPVTVTRDRPGEMTLTIDEFRVAEGVVKKRAERNAEVNDQAVGKTRELEAMCAEFACAKMFNVWPDLQWSEYREADLVINGIPVDVKLCSNWGINIRWNDRHSQADQRTVYLGMEPLHINRYRLVGGIQRCHFTEQQKRTGPDGVDFYQVRRKQLMDGLVSIYGTVPQWQTCQAWLDQYDSA